MLALGPVGLPSETVKVLAPWTSRSLMIGMLIVCDVATPAAQFSVPVGAAGFPRTPKSVPAIAPPLFAVHVTCASCPMV